MPIAPTWFSPSREYGNMDRKWNFGPKAGLRTSSCPPSSDGLIQMLLSPSSDRTPYDSKFMSHLPWSWPSILCSYCCNLNESDITLGDFLNLFNFARAFALLFKGSTDPFYHLTTLDGECSPLSPNLDHFPFEPSTFVADSPAWFNIWSKSSDENPRRFAGTPKSLSSNMSNIVNITLKISYIFWNFLILQQKASWNRSNSEKQAKNDLSGGG